MYNHQIIHSSANASATALPCHLSILLYTIILAPSYRYIHIFKRIRRVWHEDIYIYICMYIIYLILIISDWMLVFCVFSNSKILFNMFYVCHSFSKRFNAKCNVLELATLYVHVCNSQVHVQYWGNVECVLRKV